MSLTSQNSKRNEDSVGHRILRNIDRIGRKIRSMLSLHAVQNPDDIDVVVLEERILYSGTPFPITDDGTVQDYSAVELPEELTEYLRSLADANAGLASESPLSVDHTSAPDASLLIHTDASNEHHDGVASRASSNPNELPNADHVAWFHADSAIEMLHGAVGTLANEVLGRQEPQAEMTSLAHTTESTSLHVDGDAFALTTAHHASDVELSPGQPWAVPSSSDDSSVPSLNPSDPAHPFDSHHAIAFVDANVDGYQDLIRQLNHDVEVVVLDAGTDGLVQITNLLHGRTGIESIYVFSHGTEGAFQVGSTWVNQFSLQWQADTFESWRSALTDNADILLYGCNVASTLDGQHFVENLAALTGADVAASEDRTGDQSYNANWKLEYATGSIESQFPNDYDAMVNWIHELAISTNGSATSAQSGGTTNLTWSHTISGGSNRELFVTMAIDAMGASVSGVTYGGVAMTQVGRTSGDHAVEIWKLANPTVGTANIVISLESNTAIEAGAIAYNGVDTTSATGTFAGASGTGTTSIVNVSSQTNDLVIGVTNWNGTPSDSTNGASQTTIWALTDTAHQSITATEAGAATVTMSSTVSTSAQWELGAVSIHAATLANSPDVVLLQSQPSSPQLITDVILIDSNLTDSDLLVGAATPGSQVFRYDSNVDSAHDVLSRVIAWAELSDTSIRTLSILSHGAAGGFELGNDWITDATLSSSSADWQQLSRLMVDGADINIFGYKHI